MFLVEVEEDGRKSTKRYEIIESTEEGNKIQVLIGDVRLTLKKVSSNPFISQLNEYICVAAEQQKQATCEKVLEREDFMERLMKIQQTCSPEATWGLRLDFWASILKSLEPNQKIQSDIICQYAFRLLIESGCNPTVVTLIEPYFYTRVILQNNAKEKERLRPKYGDINFFLDAQFLLFPININEYHWILVAIDLLKRTVIFYDSLRSESSEYYQDIHRKIQEEMIPREIFRRTSVEVGKVEFEPYVLAKCSQQKDDFNCGIFVCRYLEVIIQHIALRKEKSVLPEIIMNCFNHKNTPAVLRKKILEVLKPQ